jgi:hypothetical protein
MGDGVEGGRALPCGKRAPRVAWSEAVATAVVAGTRDGLVLRDVCAQAGMPSVRCVVRWAHLRPGFAAELRAAREAAGLGIRGGARRMAYDPEVGEAICVRLCLGEAMVSILRDVEMPGYSTVFRWLKEVRAFQEAVILAREVQGLRLAELGWEDACAVTPETAFAVRVKLQHLRWYAGKLSPRKYGAMKPVDGGKAGHSVLHVYTKKFICGEGDREGRWSDEPATHVSSSIPTDDPLRGGEALPAPLVIREPASTWGPDATGEARGGMVEAEEEFEEGDYWG